MTAAGRARLLDDDRATLALLQRGRDWIWIAGNHDPEPAAGIGGSSRGDAGDRRLDFRHQPQAGCGGGRDRRPSASGRARQRARPHGEPALLRQRWPRMVMPAFGAYAGGLNVRDRAFAEVFGSLPSPRTCSARVGSTPSRRSVAWAIKSIAASIRRAHDPKIPIVVLRTGAVALRLAPADPD